MRFAIAVVVATTFFFVCACDRSAHNQASSVTLHYAIDGMHCEGCVAAITAEVTKVKGVTRCEVSLDQKSATIDVADASIVPSVEKAITKLGYTATLL